MIRSVSIYNQSVSELELTDQYKTDRLKIVITVLNVMLRGEMEIA